MRKLIMMIAVATATLGASSADAEWRRYETANFVIYSESGPKKVEELATGLESVDALMRMATGLSNDVEPVKVRIYEVATETDVQNAIGGDSGVAGFYHANSMGAFAVTPRDMAFGVGSFTRELVLHHEYAHHFMLQYFPSTYPSWYVEGFAELIGSSTMMPDGRIAYGKPAKHRGDTLSFFWVPVQDVLTKPADKLNDFDLYGQGWALTHFLTFSKERSPQLRRYLAAMAAGRTPEEAAKAFGDLGALNREAARYLRSGSFEYRPVPIKLTQPLFQKVEPLSAGEAALIPETIAFDDDDLDGIRKESDREREKRKRERNLERVRAKIAHHPNDAFALQLLSAAEYASANYAAAEAAADRLLAFHPTHSAGLARKSLAMSRLAAQAPAALKAAKASEAREFAMRANRANPDELLPLLAFYQSYRAVGQTPTRNAVEGLEAVVATLPQQTNFRLMLVDEYVAQKAWRKAIAALTPIANSTHDSPRRKEARELMEKLEAELAKGAAG